MRKVNRLTLDRMNILQDLFKEDTYKEYKINEYLNQGLISPNDAGMMIGYINA
ncbi:hypothetical protein HOD20_03200 [archaeon]|jgi:hypothetical protein|nr:hypothetical protein [archaeon]MBT4351510.1 hypothetical protein [archaeon]MBT4648631.1 hypothetical protein [archaeon]MBT6822496.1 hypothetical protein [archaeon]MBT7392170.1 hypothetical protein [archaeon]